MKKRLLFRYAFICSMLLALVGCLPEGHLIGLEDMRAFSVTEEQMESGGEVLKLQGYVGHSSMGITTIKVQKQENALHVLVYVRMASHERAGALDYALTVPHEVDSVTFGEKQEVVWSRGNTQAVPPPGVWK